MNRCNKYSSNWLSNTNQSYIENKSLSYHLSHIYSTLLSSIIIDTSIFSISYYNPNSNLILMTYINHFLIYIFISCNINVNSLLMIYTNYIHKSISIIIEIIDQFTTRSLFSYISCNINKIIFSSIFQKSFLSYISRNIDIYKSIHLSLKLNLYSSYHFYHL